MKIDLTTGRAAANEALAKLTGANHWPHWHCHACGRDWTENDPHEQGVCPKCGILYRFAYMSAPNFLAGLRPDGTCDEALVDGDLLWRVMRAIESADARLLTLRHSIQWEAGANAPPVLCVVGQRHEASHPHPVAALALVAEALGMLEESDR